MSSRVLVREVLTFVHDPNARLYTDASFNFESVWPFWYWMHSGLKLRHKSMTMGCQARACKPNGNYRPLWVLGGSPVTALTLAGVGMGP